ncbi:ATP-grasp domain-containing protein [bacterium]|nr:ATP-grasp domain-containing protein [bacterium]
MNRIEEYEILPGPLKLIDINVMYGANYFSGGRVIVLQIDLGIYDEVFTDAIPDFYSKLKTVIPSLHEHHCSIGKPGGFLQRILNGTLLGHVTEHVSIELQTLAGMDVAYGKTRMTSTQGIYNVVFRFFDVIAGIYAGKAALNLVNSLLSNKEFDVSEVIKNLEMIKEYRMYGPSTQAIVDEAKKRNIPGFRLDSYNLVQLGTGKYQKSIRATITSDTNFIAVETADNKYLTALMLKDAGIPVPETVKTDTLRDAQEFFKSCKERGEKLVVKPCDGYRGKNISINIKDEAAFEKAFIWAQELNETVLIQPFIPGKTFRLLIIDYKFVAAIKLIPPFITGDGVKTVKELILDSKIHSNEAELLADRNILTLLNQNLVSLESILKKDQSVQIYLSRNHRSLGQTIDVTNSVNPMTVFLAERAAKVIGLNFAGVDIITEDIEVSLLDSAGVVVEVNAAPDFNRHINPTFGNSINVAKNMIDMLFQDKNKTAVPIYSITGSSGKTIAVKLISHCLKMSGYTPGVTSSDGLTINNNIIMKGDMTLPEQVKLVLKDPTIDCAVLETPVEGILSRGLGYDFAQTGIVLNLHDKYLDSGEKMYFEDIAYAKSVVTEQVYDEGTVILNADDEFVIEMEERIYSKLIPFSKNCNNNFIAKHAANGGTAVTLCKEHIIILKGINRIELMHINNIPLTFNGKSDINHDSILATVAALHSNGIDIEQIKEGLKSFIPSYEMLTGRINVFKKKCTTVILDKAKNIHHFKCLEKLIAGFTGNVWGIITVPENRAEEEILELGILSAKIFSHIYLDEKGNSTDSNKMFNDIFIEGYHSCEISEINKITVCSIEKAIKNSLAHSNDQEFTVVVITGKTSQAYKIISKQLEIFGEKTPN